MTKKIPELNTNPTWRELACVYYEAYVEKRDLDGTMVEETFEELDADEQDAIAYALEAVWAKLDNGKIEPHP